MTATHFIRTRGTDEAMLRATVAGSFRRHMSAIHDAVTELTEYGVEVLSPADPRVVAQVGEFVFVASDRVRSIKMVEDRHLDCIAASHFLWLVAPDGYIGQSASMELGYAIANGIPIYSKNVPADGTLQKYVSVVPSVYAALTMVLTTLQTSTADTFLVNPLKVIDAAHEGLTDLRNRLTSSEPILDAEGEDILELRQKVGQSISPRPGPQLRRAAS